MKCEVMKLVHLAAAFHVTVSLQPFSLTTLTISVESSRKPAMISVMSLHPFFVELVKNLQVQSDHLASFMASDTLKTTAEILNAPAKHAIMHFRNWQALVGVYSIHAKSFLLRGWLDTLKPSIERLLASCPRWRTWASDSEFNEAELRGFVGTFDAQVTKGLVLSLHTSLVKLLSASQDMHAASALCDQDNTAKLSASKAAIQVGKDTIALREVGVLLCRDTDITVHREEVESALVLAGKVGGIAPASVINALHARAVP
jgi:hypothetical protein